MRFVWGVFIAFVVWGVVRAGDIEDSEVIVQTENGEEGDAFGRRIAYGDGYLLVGAPNADSRIGRAYVFELVAGAWVERAELSASDGGPLRAYGNQDPAITADWAAVGSPLDSPKGARSGSVYMYSREGTNWTQHSKLTASDGASEDRFGHAIDIDGGVMIVGARLDDGNRGAAYVFRFDGSAWVQEAKLVASVRAVQDEFGYQVALDGDTAVIGARQAQNNGNGAAYVFVHDGNGGWSQQAKLTDAGGAARDQFGFSVDILGDTIAIGAQRADVDGKVDQGAVFVFVRDGTTWPLEQKLTASDGVALDLLGGSVALTRDRIVAGQEHDSAAGTDQGAAYIFERSGTIWTELCKVQASNGFAGDEAGLAGVVLTALADDIFWLGTRGKGMATKLVVNAVAHAVYVVLVEAGALAAAAGHSDGRAAKAAGAGFRPHAPTHPPFRRPAASSRFRRRYVDGQCRKGFPGWCRKPPRAWVSRSTRFPPPTRSTSSRSGVDWRSSTMLRSADCGKTGSGSISRKAARKPTHPIDSRPFSRARSRPGRGA